MEITERGEFHSYRVPIHFSANEKHTPTSGSTIVHSEPMTLADFEGVRTETDVSMTTDILTRGVLAGIQN
ncbi:hypothetical protein [Nocardia sp. BMG51109]|uniref:hypothetical protein n=1 Tax=Nocardia sp. BMG51109 TaxID=1056816 RepID=UPI0004653EA6|nr:hypothetical protein [Nocardia sp. BMG51109]